MRRRPTARASRSISRRRVTGVEVRDGAVAGVHTDRGFVKTRKVLSAVAGWTTHVTKMVGLRTPLVVHPLQAMRDRAAQAVAGHIVVSASLHMYISQSSRGELVTGGVARSLRAISKRSTLDFAEGLRRAHAATCSRSWAT